MPTERGRWIKIYEKLVDSIMWQRLPGEQCKAWVGLMVKVNWQPATFFCRHCRREVSIPAGGTSKSYATLADLACVSGGVMKRLIKTLCKDGFLENRSRPRCHTLYVVKNWEFFQGDAETRPSNDPSIGDPRNAITGITSDPVTKKQKQKEEDVSGESSSEGFLIELPNVPTKAELALADFARDLALKHTKTVGIYTKPAWKKRRPVWGQAFAAIRNEPIEEEEIRAALSWAYQDRRPWKNGTLGWNSVLQSSSCPPKTFCRHLNAIKTQMKRSVKVDAAERARDEEQEKLRKLREFNLQMKEEGW